MTAKTPDEEGRLFKDAAAWEAWLRRHHDSEPVAWLRIAKKDADAPSVSYAEAVEAALCFGWIDGQKQALDAFHWLQKFTPRKPKSIWSKINREKAQALIEAGRMHAAGLHEVERAKADGRWEAAYASSSAAEVPADFQAALDRNARAAKFFATISRANRYALLVRIHAAKKPETRAKKIETFVEMLARHETLHPG